MNQSLEPTIIVIFGITGDLAQRYLLPALYHLIKDDLLSEHTEIIGVTRQHITLEALLRTTELCVLDAEKTCDTIALKKLQHKLHIHQMDLTDGDDYTGLRTYLDEIETKHGVCMNRLYYLAVPPTVLGSIVTNLGTHGLNASCQHGKAFTRLLIEKPFGYDLASAKMLIEEIAEAFDEEQVFRIDHYLAKETAQNILTFRFQNPIFEPLWNNTYITGVDITASEQIGIEGRQTFYEQTGALRDLIQSHLLQLLALVAMEQPQRLESSVVHAAKLKLLQAIEPVPSDEVAERAVRGQYNGYRQEVSNANSFVETYAAVQLFINDARWQGVPITLRTGKALQQKRTEITVTFGSTPAGLPTNHLRFSLQPYEGISIDLAVKRPGFDDVIEIATMDFSYERTFDDHGHPNAYERVLVDAVRGDRTLFATSDEVLAAWRVIEPVIDLWSRDDQGLVHYAQGSTGPPLTWLPADQE